MSDRSSLNRPAEKTNRAIYLRLFRGRFLHHYAIAFNWRRRRYIIGRDSGRWMAWSISRVR